MPKKWPQNGRENCQKKKKKMTVKHRPLPTNKVHPGLDSATLSGHACGASTVPAVHLLHLQRINCACGASTASAAHLLFLDNPTNHLGGELSLVSLKSWRCDNTHTHTHYTHTHMDGWIQIGLMTNQPLSVKMSNKLWWWWCGVSNIWILRCPHDLCPQIVIPWGVQWEAGSRWEPKAWWAALRRI